MTKRKKGKSRSAALKAPLKVLISEQFLDDYSATSEAVQKDIDSTLELFEQHKDFTPGMKPAKLSDDIWYLRAGRGTRITFNYLPDNTIYLRRCGDHSIIDKKKKNI